MIKTDCEELLLQASRSVPPTEGILALFARACKRSQWWELTSFTKYTYNVYWTIKHGKSLLYIFRQYIAVIELKSIAVVGYFYF